MIHTIKGFSVVNGAEVDFFFLEFSCFLYDPMDVGHLISSSSAFSKSSLYIWKFSVHILFKPNLKDFDHYLASMWNECNCMVVWTFINVPHSFPHGSVGKESACNEGDSDSIPGLRRSTGERIDYPLQYSWASLVAHLVNNPPAMWETWVGSLGWEDPWRRERLPTPVFWPGEFHGL